MTSTSLETHSKHCKQQAQQKKQHSLLITTVEQLLDKIETELKQQNIDITDHATAFKKTNDLNQKILIVEKISECIANNSSEHDNFALPSIDFPQDISNEMHADITELKRCFDNQCYRSAVILCGRLLETALHRRYFEVAGNDLLEKSPGMGLGNLIARLEEKGVKLDPGLSNQIHLINQVRIYSVHKKQEPFHPTKIQTHAILLYTLDVLHRLFSK